MTRVTVQRRPWVRLDNAANIFLAARGEMDPVAVILVGTLGSVVGALPWYWLGRAFGYDRVLQEFQSAA